MYFFNKKVWHPIYYVRVFVSALVALLLLGASSEFFGWPGDSFTKTMAELWFVPVSMVLFLFLFHLTKRMLAKTYDHADEEQEFILHMSKKVRRRLNYDKEDFLHLQEDEKFQRFFHDAYVVFRDGETDELNYDTLVGRFDSDYPYLEAVRFIVRETIRLRKKYK